MLSNGLTRAQHYARYRVGCGKNGQVEAIWGAERSAGSTGTPKRLSSRPGLRPAVSLSPSRSAWRAGRRRRRPRPCRPRASASSRLIASFAVSVEVGAASSRYSGVGTQARSCSTTLSPAKLSTWTVGPRVDQHALVGGRDAAAASSRARPMLMRLGHGDVDLDAAARLAAVVGDRDVPELQVRREDVEPAGRAQPRAEQPDLDHDAGDAIADDVLADGDRPQPDQHDAGGDVGRGCSAAPARWRGRQRRARR